MLGKSRERLTPVVKFRIAQIFRRRAAGVIQPCLRGADSTAIGGVSGSGNTRFGAYAALGAIGLGGAMLMANIARNRCDVPVATSQVAAPAMASGEPRTADAAKAAGVAKADPAPVADAPAPPPAVATEKSTDRVDNSPTGSIAEDAPAKPKHKARVRKHKKLDSNP